MIKKVNLNNEDETMNDYEKIENILKTFCYEDENYKVYHSTHWGGSSFGFYRIADYLFKIDKKKPIKYKGFLGKLKFINNKLNTEAKGGIRQNLIVSSKLSSVFEDEKYISIQIKEASMVEKIEEKLKLFSFEHDIKLVFRK